MHRENLESATPRHWSHVTRHFLREHDLAAVAERRDEPTIPHEQFVSELKRDGLL